MSMNDEWVGSPAVGDVEPRLERIVEFVSKGVLFVWVVSLIPWVFFASSSEILLDARTTLGAALIVVSIWSYAPAVLAAFALLERSRKAVLLPLISITATVTFDMFLGSCKHFWR